MMPRRAKSTATIQHPERRQFWLAVLHTDTVPITAIIPVWADLPGQPETQVYFLDLEAITADERRRLIRHLASRFNLPRHYVAANLNRQGVPILAEDVSLITTDPALINALI